MEIVRATVFIQAWWRGDRVRRIIKEEKLQMLLTFKAVGLKEEGDRGE